MRNYATAASASQERAGSNPLPLWQCILLILAMSTFGYWALFHGALLLVDAFRDVRSALFS